MRLMPSIPEEVLAATDLKRAEEQLDETWASVAAAEGRLSQLLDVVKAKEVELAALERRSRETLAEAERQRSDAATRSQRADEALDSADEARDNAEREQRLAGYLGTSQPELTVVLADGEGAKSLRVGDDGSWIEGPTAVRSSYHAEFLRLERLTPEPDDKLGAAHHKLTRLAEALGVDRITAANAAYDFDGQLFLFDERQWRGVQGHDAPEKPKVDVKADNIERTRELLGAGKNVAEIAAELGVDPRSVNRYKKQLAQET